MSGNFTCICGCGRPRRKANKPSLSKECFSRTPRGRRELGLANPSPCEPEYAACPRCGKRVLAVQLPSHVYRTTDNKLFLCQPAPGAGGE